MDLVPADDLPAEIDSTRHYAEPRRVTVPGVWKPYCPRCRCPWPCPTALANDGDDAA